MKTFVLVLILFFSSSIKILPQTHAGLPSAENVLVVYNSLDVTSVNIKNHYVDKRDIPETNILALDGLLDMWLTYGGSSHRIEIVQSNDIIKDTTQAWLDQDGIAGATFHAWQYFYQKIAEPIKIYLNTVVNGQPLKNTIRYIVLCKGIPYKLQARYDHSGIDMPPNKNVSLQSLLSILNNEPYYTTIFTLFNQNTTLDYTNPYAADIAEKYWYLDFRFLPDFFINDGGMKLSYLVTRLDGLDETQTKNMIDHSYLADTSGTKTWVLDATSSGFGASENAAALLKMLDFEVNFEKTNSFITNNNLFDDNEVICYASGGHNSGMPEGYIQNLLNFRYANGALFSTLESFNGHSIGQIKRRATHGLLTEFIKMGGTVGHCYPWEPGSQNHCIIYGNVLFPAYSLGYNLVDAIYMEMPDLLFENVIVGDPLTRIYKEYKTTLIASDTTITTGTIDSRIIVPQGVTLTIASGTILQLIRNAYLEINGNLVINNGAQINLRGVSHIDVENINLSDVILNLEGKSSVFVNNTLTLQNTIINLQDDAKLSIAENANISINAGSVVNATNNSKVKVNDININSSLVLNFYNQAQFIGSNVIINPQSNINFYDTSKLEVIELLDIKDNAFIPNLNNFKSGSLNVGPGATLYFNSGIVNSTFNAVGTTAQPITLTLNSGTLRSNAMGNINIKNCNINSGALQILQIHQGVTENVNIEFCNFNASSVNMSWGENISIKNCSFQNNSNPIYIVKPSYAGNVELNNILINNFGSNAINIKNVNTLIIDNCNIFGGDNGILLRNIMNSTITKNLMEQLRIGITFGEIPRIEEETILNSIIIDENKIRPINTNSYGILFYPSSINNIEISNNEITMGLVPFSTGIKMSYGVELASETLINYNTIIGGEIGIELTNGGNITLLWNSLLNPQDGILASNISNIEIVSNTLHNANSVKYTGIFLNSTTGNVRHNSISGFSYGVWLANSSPNLGLNSIFNNLQNGIYIGEGSNPYMNNYYFKVSNCEKHIYPLTGFNHIYDNGGYTNNSDDDGAEIYFYQSYAFLENGCNFISDDREPFDPPVFNTQVLMNGTITPQYSMSTQLSARNNYWGNSQFFGGNDPSERFGNLDVLYEPYLSGPCDSFLEEICPWFVTDKAGNIIDTLYPSDSYKEPSDLDLLYSEAELYFNNNNFADAMPIYSQIIQLYGTEINSLRAYLQLLTSAYILKQSNEELDQIQNLILQSSTLTNDNLLKTILEQLARIINVNKGEYLEAIDSFENIIVSEPGSEKAFYAEIDRYTTEILIETSGLSKSNNTTQTYGNKINNLIALYVNGSYSLNNKIQPSQYLLYDNYPNPFNPVTTIKYDLPKDALVQLEVFDILGKKITTLVNENKTAGSYELYFNATTLASGVYVYKLQAGDFISSKKMILLK